MSILDKYKDMKPEPKPVESKPVIKESSMDDIARVIRERELQKQQAVKVEPLQVTAQTIKSQEKSEKPISSMSTVQQVQKEPEDDKASFSKMDRLLFSKKKLQEKKDKGERLRRSEKKDIKNMEYDKTQRTRTILIGLAVFGVIFIVMARQYLPNEAMYAIILIMGMMFFFPIGGIACWNILDPVMRCKRMRQFTKRNYGIVGFVGKGMKAVLKIKNFDDGIIWRDKACWVLTKDKIIQTTKDGNAITSKERTIDAESVITLVDTVPMIYVDLDSMEPLMLHQKGREAVYPLEIGATLKAWEDNQRAKMMSLKKIGDILLYVTIICAAGALVVSFLNYQKIQSMASDLETMRSMLSNMSQLH